MKPIVAFVGIVLSILLCGAPALAQQTGSVSGKLTSADGDALPGVSVEASGDVLPRPRTTMSNVRGEYRLPLLPPGNYELTFTLPGLDTEKREVKVLLQQNVVVDLEMRPESVTEALVVYGEAPAIDPSSAEIKTAVDDEVISALPVGQDYRDLVKLIPGVQYSEDIVRGPSAGGSGQDNVYQFDGVNVGLPLFGTLSAEPASYDIEQISIVKGGAKAVDFNRSGGFTINSVSRSGTNQYRGEVSYQVQTEGMTGDRKTGSSAEFDEDKDWAVANFGGPLVSDRLFFYASYYHPTKERVNRSNLYGDVPDFSSKRDELFGKLTLTPTESLLVNVSHRTSDREDRGTGVADEDTAGTASNGSDARQDISILEGSWIVSDKSFVTFKYTDYTLDTSGRPDNLLDFDIFVDGSLALDVANLDRQGLLLVPQPIAGQDAYNAFIAPYIDRYGFLRDGVRTGGGFVGVDDQIDSDDFGRKAYEISFDRTFGNHELHFGYQWSLDDEDLERTSNGWGQLSIPGGRTALADGTPIFFEARFEQQSLRDATGEVIPPIHSEFESQSIELNDTFRLKNWTFNLGAVVSNDKLFGQGLREASGNVSGFELDIDSKYKMHEDDWSDLIQPRLGFVRSLQDGRATAYASWSRYHPAASSLPRAASWARNLRQSIRAFFDAQGNIIGVEPVSSSSGKFFQEDLDPRAIDEYLVGYSRQFSNRWTAKVHARYRYAYNFWEDTNNNARLAFDPPEGIPQELYIPNLDDFRAEVGGSSYVIAELDGAFTKYYEVSLDAEWRGQKAFVQGSYVWSHYYGNFDQDNTTTENDDNIFIGSSFIADGAGRQLWNFRYGDLRGDRRHQLKLYGYYNFDWNGSAGFYAVYQSGQPWETWNVEVYRNLTSSTSDTSRFAEPAGSRTTDDHYQIDLNYTQNFRFRDRYNVQLRADLFNVTDRQTGYDIQNKFNSANFGEPRRFYNPRRLQLLVAFQF